MGGCIDHSHYIRASTASWIKDRVATISARQLLSRSLGAGFAIRLDFRGSEGKFVNVNFDERVVTRLVGPGELKPTIVGVPEFSQEMVRPMTFLLNPLPYCVRRLESVSARLLFGESHAQTLD